MGLTLQADVVVGGEVRARMLRAHEPLSFWGGYDAATGEIIDRRHPLSGQRAAGHVLVLPGSRGSSTGTAILLEAVRTGQAPAALVTDGRDTFFALAAIVARLMYGRSFVVLWVEGADLARLPDAALVHIDLHGTITVEP